MAFLFIPLLVLISTSVESAAFNGFTTKIKSLGGYSQNVNYDSQHCIVNFVKSAPSSCGSITRGIIYLDKNVGNVMCSIPLTAYVTGKEVDISSHDECDRIHNAPVIRYLGITN